MIRLLTEGEISKESIDEINKLNALLNKDLEESQDEEVIYKDIKAAIKEKKALLRQLSRD